MAAGTLGLTGDRGARRAVSPYAVARGAATLWTLSRHGVRGAWGRDERARRAARELREAFTELGPTYVKLGQLVASSPGLFPDVLAEEFRSLLDRVPPAPYSGIRRVVEDDLGAPPEEAFASFDPVPLASASVAQVHAARGHDGADLVVKVRRPGLGRRLAADLQILRQLAWLLDRTSDRGRMANPVAVVEDFALTLNAELNFVVEARAMETFAAHLRSSSVDDTVRVPTVVWPATTPRVLTMERIHGYPIDDVAGLTSAGWDLAAALKNGVRAWLEAALQHGFFHGDVHAGNLMLDTDGRLVFLDFGITGRLDERTRTVLATGLPALLVDRDFTAVARSVYELGAVLRPRDLDDAARDVAQIVEPLLDRTLADVSYGEVLVEIIRVGASYDVRLPRELVLVAKQLLYFERYAKLLAPDWTILADPDLLGFLFAEISDNPDHPEVSA